MIEINTYSQLQQVYKYLRKQKEDQKFFKYLEVAATFILVLVLLVFAIKPTADAISTLLGEIKSKELYSQKLKAKINSVIQAQESYSQVQEKYSVIQSSLPDNPRYYQAASSFSHVSQQSNVSLSRIGFNVAEDSKKEKSSSTNITTYNVQLDGTSSYPSIISYIESILNSRRLIDLETIKLSTDDKQTLSTNGININLDSNLFYIYEKN